MKVSEMDWQTGSGTILHRMKHLLESGEQSDVEFLVGKEPDNDVDDNDEEDEEKGEPQLFKAHKIVLAGWDVFDAQFRTNESNSVDNVPIRVIDITASAFKAMLNFLYMNNDVSLINSENYLDVYSAGFLKFLQYLAKKYMLPRLIEKCHELASKMLDRDNSIAIWRTAKLQEDEILIEHCLEYFDKYFFEIYNEDFCSLSQAELGEMLVRDTLMAHFESLLFGYLDYWAKKQCKNDDEEESIVEPTGQEKRAKIGPLINAIRFPLISPTTFINRIVPTGILNAEEIATMFVHYSENANDASKQLFPLPFSVQPRALSLGSENNKLVDKNMIIQ